jgi:hypothetical protein
MNLISTLRRFVDRVGWTGLLGVILVLSAGGFSLFVVQPKTAQLIELSHANQSLKAQIEQTARTGIPETGSQDDLTHFYAFFTGFVTTKVLGKLYTAAAEQNLVLAEGEYHMTPDQTGRLIRYQIVLPVAGSYVQIRQFVEKVLIDVPIAALDEISFKRETIDSPKLSAIIKLTLFMDPAQQGVD